MAIFKKEKKPARNEFHSGVEEKKTEKPARPVRAVHSGGQNEISRSGGDSPEKTTQVKTASVTPVVGRGELENVLIKPHITEKASALSENNVYVFEVDKRASKTVVKAAMKEIYKVNPIKINIVNSPSKRVISRGIKGVKSGKKKAVVFLKKGDSIEII